MDMDEATGERGEEQEQPIIIDSNSYSYLIRRDRRHQMVN